MPFISLCMIARNEEDRISHAIRSCAGVADEVIVVDTGPTDATFRIAAELGAYVERMADQPHVSFRPLLVLADIYLLFGVALGRLGNIGSAIVALREAAKFPSTQAAAIANQRTIASGSASPIDLPERQPIFSNATSPYVFIKKEKYDEM